MQFVLLLVLSIAALVSAQSSILTDAMRTSIVNSHNNERSLVGVAGLSWDSNLETIATNWALNCNFGHSTTDERGQAYATAAGTSYDQNSRDDYVGENIAEASGDGVDISTMGMSMWNDEKQDWDCESNTCSSDCGHYTQVVWALTTKVGCGVVNCPDMQYMVCNYLQGGNYNNEHPFPVAQCGGASSSPSTPASPPPSTPASPPPSTPSPTPSPRGHHGGSPSTPSSPPPSTPASPPPPPPSTPASPPPPPATPASPPAADYDISDCEVPDFINGYYQTSSSMNESIQNGNIVMTDYAAFTNGGTTITFLQTLTSGFSGTSNNIVATVHSGGSSSTTTVKC